MIICALKFRNTNDQQLEQSIINSFYKTKRSSENKNNL